MFADHIRRHKEETNLELYNPDHATKAAEIYKKCLIFEEQFENVEYHIKIVRQTHRDYLTKVTEDRKYTGDAAPQVVDPPLPTEPPSATPAMDLVQKMERDRTKSKNDESENGSEEVISEQIVERRKVRSKGSMRMHIKRLSIRIEFCN